MSDKFTADNLNKTFAEIFQQTDRASAIVSGSLLEEILERLLLAFFVDHEGAKKHLFDGVAPLSTLSSKITLCYYLGLINKSEFEDLKLIKNIRNDFAHSVEGIDFENERIKSKCVQLKTLANTKPPEKMMKEVKNIRTFFQINVTLLGTILYSNIEKIKPLTPFNYQAARSAQ